MTRIPRLLAFLGTALGAVYGTPPQVSSSAIVELPPMIVAESAIEKHWYYAELPGLEILSSCAPSLTRDYALRYYNLMGIMRTVVPERFLLTTDAPLKLILVSEHDVITMPDPVIRELMGQALRDFRPTIFPIPVEGTQLPAAPAPRQPPRPMIRFFPNMRLWDDGEIAIFTVVRPSGVIVSEVRLARDFVSYLLRQRRPPLPQWVAGGFEALYGSATLTDREFIISELSVETVKLLTAKREVRPGEIVRRTIVLPMTEIFRPDAPSDQSARRQYDRAHRAQTAAFLRWCLEPKAPARAAALWKLVEESESTHVTETLFQKHFGCDFESMEDELHRYVTQTAAKNETIVASKAPKPPAINVRTATRTEVAHLKGAWERLEVAYVKNRFPHLIVRYADQAGRTLRRNKNGDGDPTVIAQLGLLECELGNDVAALPLLEIAAKANIQSSRLHYELARIRVTTAVTESPLSIEQTAELLGLVFACRERSPIIEGLYELLATIWENSTAISKAEHLAVLDEGIRLFPRNTRLILRAAHLYAKRGFPDRARELAQKGLAVASDSQTRQAFAALGADAGSQRN